MKKVDLHIHTVSTPRESPFVFDMSMLKRYVSETGIDAIAITNHDLFDRQQFGEIAQALDIAVFPGVEVTLDCGHVLVIGDLTDSDVLDEEVRVLRAKFAQQGRSATVDDLTQTFDLGQRLVIPHYEKKPAIGRDALNSMTGYVSAGEVDCVKKYVRVTKDRTKLTPVLFSDTRVCSSMECFPTRQTYVDCGELTLGALKTCLRDRAKVALSEKEGNKVFQVLEDGQMLSTGLNVLLGERSSGKTYTLDRINSSQKNVKYVRQFDLVQRDDATCAREFTESLRRDRSQYIDEFLAEFKMVLGEVTSIDLRGDERVVEEYVISLLDAAEQADRNGCVFQDSIVQRDGISNQ